VLAKSPLRDLLGAGHLALSFEIELEVDHLKLRHVAGQVKSCGVSIGPMAHFENEPIGVGAPETRRPGRPFIANEIRIDEGRWDQGRSQRTRGAAGQLSMRRGISKSGCARAAEGMIWAEYGFGAVAATCYGQSNAKTVDWRPGWRRS
jgi:hypothetical protein